MTPLPPHAPPAVLSSVSHPALSREVLREFCDYISSELGIKMSEAKHPMLQSRLHRRLHALGLPSLDAYREYLLRSPAADEERVHFIDAVTTNKTDFFREPTHFEYLACAALPSLDSAADSPALAYRHPWHCHIWCAGCATGEEAYSLAMTLAEYAEARPAFEFTVLATDISTRALAHAQRAIYDEERIAPVSVALRHKYLLRNCDSQHPLVRIASPLRRHVSFARLNFMEPDYRISQQFDAIFFRNVMIYFDKPTQEAVVNKLCRHLAPGGYLFVGHAESLAGLDIPVSAVASAVYRKPEKAPGARNA